MTWSARQYRLFEDARTRPAHDLVAAIPRDRVATAIDLGCGPGNSTEVLLTRYPDAAIGGIDSSQDMIDAATARLPGVAFEVADIAQWRSPRAMDVILANASLQWLPRHDIVYPQLVEQLSEGGVLAVQTPDNLDEPAHRLAREVAAQGPWAEAIGRVKHPDRHEAQWYYALLKPQCAHVDVWRTTYFHPLPDHRAIVEWFKGSALRPYLEPLPADQQQAFLSAYQQAITYAYPALDDGTVLLPFPRLFVVATR